MRLLVTRPAEEAASTAEALRALGHQAVLEPLLTIRYLDVPLPPPEGYQALVVSSVNGLRAFTRLSADRSSPVFAVGPASAAEARAAGFQTVRAADGDARDLATLVAAHLSPTAGPLLQPAGSVVTGSLSEGLAGAGFTLNQPVLYRAEAAEALSTGVRTELTEGTLDGVLLFSPRTARTFVSLVKASALDACCARMIAYCLSPAVAAAAQDRLVWQGVRVADQPNQAALLRCLRTTAAPPGAREDVMEQHKPNDESVGDGTPAERVIARFGGLRPMAHKLEIPVSTVQGWKNRGQIPASRHAEIRAAAERHGIALDQTELTATGGEPESPASATDALRPSVEPVIAAPAVDTSFGRESDAGGPSDEPGPVPAGEGEKTDPHAPAYASAPVEASWAPAGGEQRRQGNHLVLGLLLGAAILLGGAVVAVLARDVWLPWVGQPTNQAVTELRERSLQLGRDLSALSQRVEQLPTQQGAGQEAVASLGQQVETLDQQLSALRDGAAARSALDDISNRVGGLQQTLQQTSGTVSGLDQQVTALNSRIDGVVQRLDQERMRAGGAIALVLGANQLRSAAAQGIGFVDSLATLRRLAGNDEEVGPLLERLQPHAAAGVPSLPALRDGFEALSAEALAASQGGGSELGAAIMDRVSSLISIRPTGQAAAVGDSAADLLARAQGALDRGELAAAVAAVKELPEDGRQVLSGWLQDAEARLEMRQALDALEELALGRLAQLRG